MNLSLIEETTIDINIDNLIQINLQFIEQLE